MANLQYASGEYLLQELDKMVTTGDFSKYREVREILSRRLRGQEMHNARGAGAKPKYDRQALRIAELKRQGFTTRQIAEQIGCSQSTVVRMLEK